LVIITTVAEHSLSKFRNFRVEDAVFRRRGRPLSRKIIFMLAQFCLKA